MTDLTILLPTLLACGITALLTSVLWAGALERERSDARELRRRLKARRAEAHAARTALTRAHADLRAAGIAGRDRHLTLVEDHG